MTTPAGFSHKTSAIVFNSAREGYPLLILLVSLNFAWILLGLALRFPRPSGQAPWLGDPQTILLAAAEHAVAGLLVGGTSLSVKKALIGAVFQPLIDIDHISAFVHLPLEPRIGHSVILMACLILVAWRARVWPSGPVDLASFVSSQFLIHFAVAPPGFPLFTPVTPFVFYFSSAYPAVAGIALASAGLLRIVVRGGPWRGGSGRRASP